MKNKLSSAGNTQPHSSWRQFAFLILFTCCCGLTTAIAQTHFGSEIPISPIGYGIDPGDGAGQIRLRAQPDLSMDILWNSSGDAVFSSGLLAGGWANAVDSIAWEFKYTLVLTKLENGEYLVSIDWVRRSATGQIQEGRKSIGKIKQNSPGESEPITYGSTTVGGVERTDNVASLLSGGNGTATGRWETIIFFTQYGYAGSNGVYYVIAVRHTITIWVMDGTGGGGNGSEN